MPLPPRLRRRVAWRTLLVVLLMAAALVAALLVWRPWRSFAAPPTPRPGPGDLASAELGQAARRGESCSAANAVGVGLRGVYYAGEQAQGQALLERVDATVNFDARLEWPQALAATPPRSVRWSGWIRPTLSGRYRFHADVPGARVTVGRETLVGEAAPPDAAIELAAGRYYPITVEIGRLAAVDAQRIKLEWTAPHGARYVVPRALLYQPTEMVSAR